MLLKYRDIHGLNSLNSGRNKNSYSEQIKLPVFKPLKLHNVHSMHQLCNYMHDSALKQCLPIFNPQIAASPVRHGFCGEGEVKTKQKKQTCNRELPTPLTPQAFVRSWKEQTCKQLFAQ